MPATYFPFRWMVGTFQEILDSNSGNSVRIKSMTALRVRCFVGSTEAKYSSTEPNFWDFISPNYSLSEGANHSSPFHGESAASIFQPWTPEFWIVWRPKNKECMPSAVPASTQQKQFSRRGFHLIYFAIHQEWAPD